MTIDAQTIRHLLDDHGQTVTFKRVTEGTYDPGTGQTGSGTTDTESVKVAFVDYAEFLIDGDTIQRGDRKGLMANNQADGTALNKTPQPGDELTGEGDDVRVVNVKTLKPGGVVVGYEMQCRE